MMTTWTLIASTLLVGSAIGSILTWIYFRRQIKDLWECVEAADQVMEELEQIRKEKRHGIR